MRSDWIFSAMQLMRDVTNLLAPSDEPVVQRIRELLVSYTSLFQRDFLFADFSSVYIVFRTSPFCIVSQHFKKLHQKVPGSKKFSCLLFLPAWKGAVIIGSYYEEF